MSGTLRRALATLAAATVAAAMAAPAAPAATNHPFAAGYTGKGSGSVTGITASGSATMTGGGRSIGRGTLSGSGKGVFTSEACVVFSGTALLEGTAGSLKVSAQNGNACAQGGDGDTVSFSGRAKVVRGTSTFAGAQGTLGFTGTFDRQTGTVKISFKGRITY